MVYEEDSELQVGNATLPMMNASGVPTDVVLSQARVGPNPYVAEGSTIREIASTLSRWVDNARAATGRTTMFDRGAYTPPDNPYDEMRSARTAVRYDSIASGVGEITEAYAFQGIKWEGSDPDHADVFNQLAIEQNLDGVIRSMWREEYTYGQFVCAKLWGWREFTVRGETKKGNQRKRKFKIWAPLRLRVLDVCKVVPVGVGPLGGETLAWSATPGEVGHFNTVRDRATTGDIIDPLMLAFFRGRYQPWEEEQQYLAAIGVDVNNLLEMADDWVFRHTITKADYQPFPDIRMKSVFRLLDLKNQLMASDRAMLVGAANYILLIKKGEKDNTAKQEELEALKSNFNFIAKLPVIISDHRLSIEIIAPKTDLTLDQDKYDVLDQRILGRLLGTLTLNGGRQGGKADAQTVAMSVARVMENRRHMLRRTLEREIARSVVQHPKNKDSGIDTEPNLVFTPRNIALSMDQGYVQALMALRTQREISRETILEFFGLDESVEAQRVDLEKEIYDDRFQSILPFSGTQPSGAPGEQAPAGEAAPAKKTAAPAAKKPAAKKSAAKKPAAKKTPNGTPEAPGVSGARGGRPRGGGTSSNDTTKVKRTPPGTPRPKPRKA